MIRPPVEANSGLAAVLRGVIADFQHASGADIVSIFLYEESTHTYYAPFATGQIRGTPRSLLLEKKGANPEQVIDKVAERLAAAGGAEPFRVEANALVVRAQAY